MKIIGLMAKRRGGKTPRQGRRPSDEESAITSDLRPQDALTRRGDPPPRRDLWRPTAPLDQRAWTTPCLLLLLTLTGSVPAAKLNGPPLGSSAPAFSLPDIHGKQVSLDDYRGKVVVLNFWAFWCDTWKAEMPHLQDLMGRQDELGFRLVAVSVDGTRLPEFQRCMKGQVPFPVLMDVGGQVRTQYRVSHVPTVVIIDRAGRIRYMAYGYPGNYVVLRELRKLASHSGV